MTSPRVAWEIPNYRCWNPATRAEVMNTIALDVRPSVFKATHFPSFLRQAGAAPGTFVPVTEAELLEDFLSEEHLHVFNVAVGDSGTGKSHLIRWMLHEIEQRNARVGNPWWVVAVPRSSANLADVVRRVLRGFDGEVVARLRAELDKEQNVSLEAAETRVLDEIAFVLERAYEEGHWATADFRPIELLVFRFLPSLLHVRELRRVLVDHQSGIVNSLARHVLGRRDSRNDLEAELRWHPSDLRFEPTVAASIGGEAGELAVMLMDDEDARVDAVAFLNRAVPDALRNLLRFRKGDMQRALAEIRHTLWQQDKELVLLIEDLSVSEGLNAELVEALQVRTRDTGEDLCRIRSIVGVTNEDYVRMQENIRVGRTLRTVFFNVPLGDPDRPGGVVQHDVLDFASRYLNAARYEVSQLDEWADVGDEATLPSLCSECPLLVECHTAFGAIDGRGLYPLSPTALDRLYRNVSSDSGPTSRSFNPRLLVGRVLSGVLEDAERTLPKSEFPSPTFAMSFDLNSVTAEVQLLLREEFAHQAGRVQRALELYAETPLKDPTLPAGIAAAFALPTVNAIVEQGRPPRSKTVVTSPVPALVQERDRYEEWLSQGTVEDRDLNLWRRAVYDAVSARIDWDVEQLALIADRFKAGQIWIEGQHTQIRGEQILRIPRSPEAVIAIRALTEGLASLPEPSRVPALVQVRQRTELWAELVRQQLRRYKDDFGDPTPLTLAIELLVLGARLRGRGASTVADLLAISLEPWQREESAAEGQAWRGLSRAFRERHGVVRDLVLKDLACTKGAHVGGILDPSPALDTLKQALSSATPSPCPAESEQWVTFGPVRRLAEETGRHLTRAIDEELSKCVAWDGEMNSLVGDEPGAVMESVKLALAEAAAETLLELRANSELLMRLQGSGPKDIIDATAAVHQVAVVKGEVERLTALGGLDQTVVSNAISILRESATVLDASISKAESLLQGDGNETREELEARLRDLLISLETSLASIEHGAPLA